MYRRNKYGETIEVGKYECGSCENYEFEREDCKNYCRHYGSCYYMNDSCSHWEEARDAR